MQRFGRFTNVKLLGGELKINIPHRTLGALDNRGREIKARMTNLEPLYQEFGEYMLDRIEQRFKFQGLPRRWKRLTPETIAEKQRLGYGNKGILERTGRLRKGFRLNVTPRTIQIVNRRSSGGVNLYEVHQYGTRDKRIPARPMLLYTRVERQRLSVLAEKHIYG